MQDCIQPPELSEFVEGKLPESRAEEISSHIDDCEVCQDTVVAMSGTEDTFVGNLKEANQALESGLEPQEPAFRHGLQRLLRGMAKADSIVADAKSPQAIGPYLIEEKLGDGGMGTVFRAQHTKLKRTVALKVLPSHRWSNAQAIARFEREMEAIGQLDHPHIVRASDAGEDQGMHYLVMEYVDGLDLARLAKRLGPLPVADSCELARQAAIGLQHAHDSGLVHRDVKPSNLMLAWERSGTLSTETKPALKILDLGLALLGDEHLREEHDVTTVGALMGTLDYMSPEQGIDSHSVDHRTDIYGLGATLFKLLTGRAPYADPQYSTLMKKMTALATKPAPSLGKVRPDLPAKVVEVVDRMLARDPDERYSSAREVAEALVEPAKHANLGALLSTGVATEDPVAPEGTDTLVRLNRAAQSRVSQPAAQRGKGGGWKKWISAAAVGFLLLAAGLVYRIATDYGDIVIESDDPNVEVVLKQNEKVVESIQLKQTDGRTRIRAGKYQVEVVGASEITTFPKELLVERGGESALPIKIGRYVEMTANELVRQASPFRAPDGVKRGMFVPRKPVTLGTRKERWSERFPDYGKKWNGHARLEVAYSDRIQAGSNDFITVNAINTGDEPLTNVLVQIAGGPDIVPANTGTPFSRANAASDTVEWRISKIPPKHAEAISIGIKAASSPSNRTGTALLSFTSDQGTLSKKIEIEIVDRPNLATVDATDQWGRRGVAAKGRAGQGEADGRIDVNSPERIGRGGRERVVLNVTNTGTEDLTGVRIRFIGDQNLLPIDGTPGFRTVKGPPVSFEWMIDKMAPGYFQAIDVEVEAALDSSVNTAKAHLIVDSDQGQIRNDIEIEFDDRPNLAKTNTPRSNEGNGEIEMGFSGPNPIQTKVGEQFSVGIRLDNKIGQPMDVVMNLKDWSKGIRPVVSHGQALPNPDKGIERTLRIAPGISEFIPLSLELLADGPQRFIATALSKDGQVLDEVAFEHTFKGEMPLRNEPEHALAQTKPNYKVQAGDILGVFIPGILGKEKEAPPVYQDKTGTRSPALGYPIPVREDGRISIPYISNQRVVGLTIPEIEEQLRKALTIDKKVLGQHATILISVIRKVEDAANEQFSTSTTPRENGSTRPLRSPRYDGRTLSEWLEDVEYERSTERLVSAIKAVDALATHPDNEHLVDQSITEILKLMRQYGDYPIASTPHDELLERSWLTLKEMPQDKVVDHIISELEHGNPKSRRFLFFVWQVVYEKVNTFVSEDAEKRIRVALAKRHEKVSKALLHASKTDVDLAVEFLFHLATQPGWKSTPESKQVFKRGLLSNSKRAASMSLYQLAIVDRETPGLAGRAKAILKDPYGEKPSSSNYNDHYERAIASSYLTLLSLDELGPSSGALNEVAEFLDKSEFVHWNQQAFYPPIPGWQQIWSAGNGMGGMGGGMLEQPRSNKKCNFRPVILRILSAYGDDEVQLVMPSLLSSFARAPIELPSWRKKIVEIDPSLAKPVLQSVAFKEAFGKDKGTLYDVFGTVKRGEDAPPIQYLADHEHSIDNREMALILAKLLSPTQKVVGQRLGIEFNQDQFPSGNGIDDSHFAISSYGSRRIRIVLPDPQPRGGEFLMKCITKIQDEVESQWKALKPSATLTIDLTSFAKRFDAERKVQGGFAGGMGGGGMF